MRPISVTDGRGWVLVEQKIDGEFVHLTRLPPNHTNALLLPSGQIRITTNGEVSCRFTIFNGEDHRDVTP